MRTRDERGQGGDGPPVIKAVLPCSPKSELRYSFSDDMVMIFEVVAM